MKAHNLDLKLITSKMGSWYPRQHEMLMQTLCLRPDRTVTARWQVVVCLSTTPTCCRCCSSAIVKASHLQPPSAGRLWRCCSSSPSTSKGGNEPCMFGFIMPTFTSLPSTVSVMNSVKCTFLHQRAPFPAGYFQSQAASSVGKLGCLHGLSPPWRLTCKR